MICNRMYMYMYTVVFTSHDTVGSAPYVWTAEDLERLKSVDHILAADGKSSPLNSSSSHHHT